jgi:hypothetical protein
MGGTRQYVLLLRRGADKSLAFLISPTVRLQHNQKELCVLCVIHHRQNPTESKIIFLGWVKEVRTTKS